MMSDRIAVTGIGLVTAAGVGAPPFCAALGVGKPCATPVKDFNAAPFGVETAAQIVGLDPTVYLGKAGLRLLDRATKTVLVAGVLVCDDAELGDGSREDLGIALATTYGSLPVQAEFDRETLKTGANWVNPAMLPYTVPNAQAGNLSIRTKAAGPNLSIQSGPAAGLLAINTAADLVRWGHASSMLAGGVDIVSFDVLNHLDKLGTLGSEVLGQDRLPFSRRSSGIMVGEAACLLHLETESSARAAGRRIYGYISGQATWTAPDSEEPSSEAFTEVASAALKSAAIEAAALGWVCSGASGWRPGDAAELAGLRATLEASASDVPVSTTKVCFGECFGASGALQVAAALLCGDEHPIPEMPPAMRYLEGVCIPDRPTYARERPHVLCQAVSPGGVYAATVVERRAP